MVKARLGFMLLFISSVANSLPWIEAGDMRLRHDIRWLADEAHIIAPVNAWPLGWVDAENAIASVGALRTEIDSGSLTAISGLQPEYQRASELGHWKFGAGAGLGDSSELRTYVPGNRGDAAVEGWLDYTGEHFAMRLTGKVVAGDADRQKLRADESFVGFRFGNWSFSANTLSKWWGPGYVDSGLLSTNARPIPALEMQRIESQPKDIAILRWLGPTQFRTFVGQLEQGRVVPNTFLWGARADVRPLRNLEIGLSRTAMFGGDGRPTNLGTFLNVLFGNDNCGGSGIDDCGSGLNSNEPGNQLAAIDWRLSFTPWDINVAVYNQMTFEDEAGGYPSRGHGFVGVEFWHQLDQNNLRWYLEYNNTALKGLQGEPIYNSAYNHGIYLTGYRYRGDVIGSSLDNDARALSLGSMASLANGDFVQVELRHVELNVDGTGLNSVSNVSQNFINLKAMYQTEWRELELQFGAQWRSERVQEDPNRAHLFVRVEKNF